MADKEISGLTAATTPLAGTELVHIDQGGNSRKVALTDVVAIATGAMLKATYDPNDDGVIAVAQGGTGGATASAARTNLGLGTMAVQNAGTVAITGGTITGITDLTVADGGTGASDASTARTNLGLAIGTDVQAYSANLAGFAATTVANVQNRVNHTGTQLASTISDFSTAADARVSAAIGSTVQAYSANLDGWSAITAASKLDASVIPDADDGKILTWEGTSLVNRAAGDLGVLVVGDDVQAWSANLDSWSALATSAKQDASANLTTLAAVTPGSKGLAILADTSSDAVHEELAKDWSDGTSGAPTLSIPNVMQRRYVDVGAYASLTDTDDAHAAIQAAFDDANGREIVFTNPYGGTRYYRSLTRPASAGQSAGALQMPKKARIIMEPGALLDFSDWATSGEEKRYLYAEASAPTAVNLASNALITANSIVLTDGSSFAARDDIIIVSDDLYTTEDGSVGTKGEWAFVTAVSGNTLTIAGRLRDTYNTAATARVYRMSDLCELTLEGINLRGCGRFDTDVAGDRGIVIVNGKNCHVIGGSIEYSDQNSLTLVNVLNGSVEGTTFRIGPKVSDSVNQYGPHFVNMCENVHFRNIDVIGGKEASGLSATGGIQGVTRDCSITHSRFRGAWRSGCSTHDNHTGFEFSHNTVEDCEQGVDNRIIGGTYKNNIFRRMGSGSGALDCAIQLGSGAQKVLFEGNTVEDALRGVYMGDGIVHETAPGDIDIINNDMRGMRGHGVDIHYTASATDALGTVTVNGLRFKGNGSAASRAVEIEGKWKVVVDGVEARDGNGSNAVFLHATDNGAGTNGPVDPVIRNVKYDSSFAAIAVSHHSGLLTAAGNRRIGATAPTAVTLTGSGVATMPTLPLYTITSNTGTSDDFDSIIAMASGSQVTYQATSGHTITVRNNGGGTGNIRTKSGASVVLSGDESITLVCDGTNWIEASDNPGEGTFTPAITFDTPGNLAVTYSTQIGRYTKIGRVVFYDITIITSAFTHTTASGNLRITGLPFTVGASYSPLGQMEWQGITKAGYTDMAARLVAGQTYALVLGSGSGVAKSAVTTANMPTGGSVSIFVSGCYAV